MTIGLKYYCDCKDLENTVRSFGKIKFRRKLRKTIIFKFKTKRPIQELNLFRIVEGLMW